MVCLFIEIKNYRRKHKFIQKTGRLSELNNLPVFYE